MRKKCGTSVQDNFREGHKSANLVSLKLKHRVIKNASFETLASELQLLNTENLLANGALFKAITRMN